MDKLTKRSVSLNQNSRNTVRAHRDVQGNSDRIRQKFGSYGIEIVETGPAIRVSNLYSVHSGKKISRTFAVVTYPAVMNDELMTEHQSIISGQSIGIVFKEHGWDIDKRHQYFGQLEILPTDKSPRSVFGEDPEVQPAIHVYTLFVTKSGACFHYASIAEVHHPDYLKLQDLKDIYSGEFAGHSSKSSDIKDILALVHSRIQKA